MGLRRVHRRRVAAGEPAELNAGGFPGARETLSHPARMFGGMDVAAVERRAREAEARIACADCEESVGFAGSFGSIALVDSWESFPNPGKVIRHVEAALEPGGRLLILTPNFTFKPLLWTLETLRIKKLRPAFVYGNSRLSRTRRLVGAGFRELEVGSFFYGLERYFLFEKGA